MSAVHEWLNLIEVTGPFLADPVLRQTLPDGLDVLPKGVAPRLRSAYDEWREAVEDRDPQLDRLHAAWINEVLTQALEYDDSTLLREENLPATVLVDLPEHGTTLRPDMVLVEPARRDTPLMLLMVTEPDADLDASIRQGGYVASPKERMVTLLRGSSCPLGLVTNGEAWALVHAPEGTVASNATWYARMFGLERDTLRAFASLLGIHRFTGPSSERLPELYEHSLQHQGDVTEALGDQVAQAIEVLMHALDRADQDRNRELLKDVAPKRIYEAGLTLMMRLVVILSAEERDLLLLGDPIYDEHYAITSMRSQLLGVDPAVLATRQEAWSRLLATFRLVYAGSDHPDLRLPALGGSLFDPDRFPFLEGRPRGSNWREEPASPLPIDDRTVLLLLNAIQTFRGRTLSYKALDVEQIGHVYEGLLDQTVGRIDGVTLQLKRPAKVRTPLVSLTELEAARDAGLDTLVERITESTERSEAAVRNDLTTTPDKDDVGKLLTSCRGDEALRDRILPFVRLLDDDPWGMPLVHQAGAIVIVKGTDRRESGSHYTPKSLTEKIVEETLTPVVYLGPAEGVDRKDWKLKTPAEILDLRICDPAMGSGAFLVQVCRWLSDRLVESWAASEAEGHWVDAEGVVHEVSDSVLDPMPGDTEERTVEARRLIAERCLYGVDTNPLAVELAKLSLWLTTVAKGRPFGFLDHNLRHGDSLLGIDDLDQVIKLRMDPKSSGQLRLFGRSIEAAVEEALKLRRELRTHPVRDIEDVRAMERLDARSRQLLELPEVIADAFIGCVLAEQRGRALEVGLTAIASLADSTAEGDSEACGTMIRSAGKNLAKDEPHGRSREPFHWPLEFPEVFERRNGGFDAIVGNPPFIGGKQIPTRLGAAYSVGLKSIYDNSKGAADLVCYFFRRSFSLLRASGCMGLIATKSIAETSSRTVGLDPILSNGGEIYRAITSLPWPGAAAVIVSVVNIHNGEWQGARMLNGVKVPRINSSLSDNIDFSSAHRLKQGIEYSEGVKLYGKSFVIDSQDVRKLNSENPGLTKYLRKYVNGDVLNGTPNLDGGLLAVDFGEREEIEIHGCDIFLEILKRKVAEERKNQTRQIHEHRPWLHWDKRASFLRKARKLDRIIACVIVQRHLIFHFVEPESLFAHGIKLFLDDRANTFACLQSSLHEVWVRGASSKLGKSIRYSTSASFDTFPFPSSIDDTDLIDVGERYSKIRQAIAKQEQVGLTELYNKLHDRTVSGGPINALRELHEELDARTLATYGWDDLQLRHGFHEVQNLPESDRVRFTISEQARLEVLQRLAELNLERFQEEAEIGLHGDIKSERKPKSRERKNAAVMAKGDSFELELDHKQQSHGDGK